MFSSKTNICSHHHVIMEPIGLKTLNMNMDITNVFHKLFDFFWLLARSCLPFKRAPTKIYRKNLHFYTAQICILFSLFYIRVRQRFTICVHFSFKRVDPQLFSQLHFYFKIKFDHHFIRSKSIIILRLLSNLFCQMKQVKIAFALLIFVAYFMSFRTINGWQFPKRPFRW